MIGYGQLPGFVEGPIHKSTFGGMLGPPLGPGAGMNPTTGRGGYRDRGIPSKWDTFDYLAWNKNATSPAFTNSGLKIADTSEAIINRGTEEIAESEREASRNATANAAAAGVSNAGDLQRGQQRMQSQYAGMRANLARDVRQQQADRESELARWKAELEERRRQFDASLAAQNQNNSGGGGGRGGSGGTDWTQDINDFMGGKGGQMITTSRGRNREGARNKNAELLAEVQSRMPFAPAKSPFSF